MELAELGVCVTGREVTEDLGVVTSAWHKRRTAPFAKRISKMKKRMQRELLKVKRLGGTPKQTSSANFAQLFEQF